MAAAVRGGGVAFAVEMNHKKMKWYWLSSLSSPPLLLPQRNNHSKDGVWLLLLLLLLLLQLPLQELVGERRWLLAWVWVECQVCLLTTRFHPAKQVIGDVLNARTDLIIANRFWLLCCIRSFDDGDAENHKKVETSTERDAMSTAKVDLGDYSADECSQ